MTNPAEAQEKIDAVLRGAVEAREVPGVVAMATAADGPIYDHEEVLRRGLLALVERAPVGADLGHVGAEPVENAVIEDGERIRWIEDQAQRSPSFQAALANVWIHNLSRSTFLRIEHAAGTELPWPASAGPRPVP